MQDERGAATIAVETSLWYAFLPGWPAARPSRQTILFAIIDTEDAENGTDTCGQSGEMPA
jgi:hypothetical protein